MDLLFSIFEFLIVAGGPFCIFAGMDTGKLKFKNIVAADSSIEITENAACVTLKSNGSALLVTANKIPWGNTSSITWGFLEADNSVHAITGAYIISNNSNSLIGTSFSSGYNNLIIRPNSNSLFGTNNDNIIVNSKQSRMCNIGRRSAIIGGIQNVICSGDQSSIIDSYCSTINESTNSTIISGTTSNICGNYSSTIIASAKSRLTYTPSGDCMRRGSIVSSYCGCIRGSDNSSVISSRLSCIVHCNPLGCASSNSIISSCSSSICGGQLTGGITVGTLRSSILSACCGCIFESCDSSIIGGKCNIIKTNTYSGGNIGTSNNCQNTIIGGYKNSICASDSPESYGSVKNNSILSSRGSDIFTIDYKSYINNITTSDCSNILSSKCSVIIGGALFGGNKVQISGSKNTAIINSPGSSVTTTNVSGIVGGCYNCISESNYVGIVGGFGNIIRSSSTNSSILGGCRNLICISSYSALISGKYNCLKSSNNSVILGGYCNVVNKINTGGVILGGFYNCIDGESAKGITGVIIAGCRNEMDGVYSVIVGGECNWIKPTYEYSAILGGSYNVINNKLISIIGSCNISTSGSNHLVITNLIFDKHVYIGSEPSPHCGFTGTLTALAPASFFIRKGFITIT